MTEWSGYADLVLVVIVEHYLTFCKWNEYL
jgi:hypothetical protein